MSQKNQSNKTNKQFKIVTDLEVKLLVRKNYYWNANRERIDWYLPMYSARSYLRSFAGISMITMFIRTPLAGWYMKMQQQQQQMSTSLMRTPLQIMRKNPYTVEYDYNENSTVHEFLLVMPGGLWFWRCAGVFESWIMSFSRNIIIISAGVGVGRGSFSFG